MLASVRDKVTDIIFKARVEGAQAPERRSAYRVAAATHQQETSYGVEAQPAEGQQSASASDGDGQAAPVVKTITRDTPKVGRNDPCPCGSGKKYKKCCGKDLV